MTWIEFWRSGINLISDVYQKGNKDRRAISSLLCRQTRNLWKINFDLKKFCMTLWPFNKTWVDPARICGLLLTSTLRYIFSNFTIFAGRLYLHIVLAPNYTWLLMFCSLLCFLLLLQAVIHSGLCSIFPITNDG